MKTQIVACCLVLMASAADFTLKLLDAAVYPEAKCLDGSAPGYYLRPGSGDGSANVKIHLQGGGWCTSLDDCQARANSVLGSSKQWSLHPTTDNNGPDKNLGCYGLLSNTSTQVFANWTAVFVRYCDGSSMSSHRADPVLVKGQNLYFRGRTILAAVLADLAPLLARAPQVLLGGTSAGGLAVYMHADFVRSQLPASVATFAAVPDAGLFLDALSLTGTRPFRAAIQAAVAGNVWFDTVPDLTNSTNAACLATVGPAGVWQCWFAQYLVPHIGSRLFVVNSLYDPVNLNMVLELPGGCASNLTACTVVQLQQAQAFRAEYQQVLANLLASFPAVGAFATACNQHEETCRDNDFLAIEIDNAQHGRTPMVTALALWLGNPSPSAPRAVFVDSLWPENDSCWVGGDHGSC